MSHREKTFVSSRLTMRTFVCIFALLSFSVDCKFLKKSEVLTDITENRERIVKIFEEVSTLSVLLRNYEQPGYLMQLLEKTFEFGDKAFAIFNFSDEDKYENWIEHCESFFNETSIQMIYYERFYQKYHEPKSFMPAIDFFEEKEVRMKEPEYFDKPNSNTSSEILSEKFADGLDKWFMFRKSGFVLICPFDTFELYLGCLINRSGTFLFIIEKDSNMGTELNEIETILKKMWHRRSNLKIFVLIFKEFYVLNPFDVNKDTNTFGILEKFTEQKLKRSFKNLNGYPINVEMFDSAYSVARDENFTNKLDFFYGPDVEVAHFIKSQMNVSSKDESVGCSVLLIKIFSHFRPFSLWQLTTYSQLKRALNQN